VISICHIYVSSQLETIFQWYFWTQNDISLIFQSEILFHGYFNAKWYFTFQKWNIGDIWLTSKDISSKRQKSYHQKTNWTLTCVFISTTWSSSSEKLYVDTDTKSDITETNLSRVPLMPPLLFLPLWYSTSLTSSWRPALRMFTSLSNSVKLTNGVTRIIFVWSEYTNFR